MNTCPQAASRKHRLTAQSRFARNRNSLTEQRKQRREDRHVVIIPIEIDEERESSYLDAWQNAANVMAAQPGFIRTYMFRTIVDSSASLSTRSGTAASLDRSVIGPFIGAAILDARDGERMATKVSGPRFSAFSRVVLPAVAAFMRADAAT
ncbi:antibiotic biosynthesis monooxygenase family protein [Streptomyces sp. NPDC088116]|uniref:antibiotic biosynthesis monooxygenase family protein n=1 Tax=Streptomyces sp. NPDC088116 TaxID=3365825 RepID=UPI003803D78F